MNFVNTSSQEIQYKIYDHEAQYGQVTHISVSNNLIAIGYSQGTILVYNLDIGNALPDPDNAEHLLFEQLHQFSFHRSSISTIIFDENNTLMYSGGNDTYIVVYDLVSDQAQFKLTGHKEQIT